MNNYKEFMDRLQAKEIARKAYKEINELMDKLQKEMPDSFPIHFHWDGCISVDDDFFTERELC